jgi:hypothetical protein
MFLEQRSTMLTISWVEDSTSKTPMPFPHVDAEIASRQKGTNKTQPRIHTHLADATAETWSASSFSKRPPQNRGGFFYLLCSARSAWIRRRPPDSGEGMFEDVAESAYKMLWVDAYSWINYHAEKRSLSRINPQSITP